MQDTPRRGKERPQVTDIDENVRGEQQINALLRFGGEKRVNIENGQPVINCLCPRLRDHARGKIDTHEMLRKRPKHLTAEAGAASEINGPRKMRSADFGNRFSQKL